MPEQAKTNSSYNILILINVRWWNASAFYALNTARVLKKYGNRVWVGTKKESPPGKKCIEWNLPHVELNFEGYNILKLIKNFYRLLKFVKENNIHIINTHRPEDNTFGALLKLIHPSVKFVITRGDRRKIRKNLFSKLIYQKIADRIIITCKAIYHQNLDVLEKVKSKVSVIYGSVNEDLFVIKKKRKEILKELKIKPGKIIVGMAGRFDYVKDQYTFLKIASEVSKEIKNVHFILAGKEEHIKINEMKQIAKTYNIYDKLTIINYTSNIQDIMNTFDICLILSTFSETISRVVMEYLFLGKPVIGTDINVIKELIKDKYNGYIIKPGDFKKGARKVIKLCKDRHLRKLMGKRSRMLYKKNYNEKTFYTHVMRVFK